jgi:inner membrane protein
MASAFSHAFAAVALGKTWSGRAMSPRFWFLAIASAVLPDADVVFFGFGVRYEDMLGHRGLTHSLPFALFWALLVVWTEFKQVPRWSRSWWSLFVFFFAVTASHGILDAFTNGGLGVAFFAPFSSARYFFPWQPIEVSPFSIREFFVQRGGPVLRSEFKYIWLPGAIFWLASWVTRKILRHFRKPPEPVARE